MANGAVLLKWRDRNWAEHGHYIYRSDTPMNINNLPSPIETLLPNQYEYIDYDVIADQTYYYRIGAFRNNDVSVSEEIEVVATPDLFGPGPQLIEYGDSSAGYFGELTTFIPSETLISLTGLTSFSAAIPSANWVKAIVNDKIIFYPKQHIISGISWDALYSHGLVYGTNNNGTNPVGIPTNQETIINYDGFDYKVRCMSMSDTDPGPRNNTGAMNSATGEIRKILIPLLNGEWESQDPVEWGFGNMNPSRFWGIETGDTGNDRRFNAGYTIGEFINYNPNTSSYAWRPILELIT